MSFVDALYVENTLGLDPAFDKTLIDSVGPSAYNLAILAFLHTRPNAPFDLYYNDTQIYQEGPNGQLEPCDPAYIQTLAQEIQELQSMEVRVILSMGPFQSDYDNIASDVPTFCANLYTMATQLGLNGFDFDYEGDQDSTHAALVASLVNGYAALASSPILTAAPYYGQEWWAGVLQQTATGGGSGNNFSWWNVQFYAGDSNPDPLAGRGDLRRLGERGRGRRRGDRQSVELRRPRHQRRSQRLPGLLSSNPDGARGEHLRQLP